MVTQRGHFAVCEPSQQPDRECCADCRGDGQNDVPQLRKEFLTVTNSGISRDLAEADAERNRRQRRSSNTDQAGEDSGYEACHLDFGIRGGSVDEASGCAHGEAQEGETRCDKQVRPEPVLKPL